MTLPLRQTTNQCGKLAEPANSVEFCCSNMNGTSYSNHCLGWIARNGCKFNYERGMYHLTLLLRHLVIAFHLRRVSNDGGFQLWIMPSTVTAHTMTNFNNI